MEAVAENGIPIVLLDRPNPNGDRIDGEVLNFKYKSLLDCTLFQSYMV